MKTDGYHYLAISIISSHIVAVKVNLTNTVHGKKFGWEKVVNLANHELFEKFSLPIFTDSYTKIVYGICTDCSLAIRQIFPHQQLLPVWFAKNFPPSKFLYVRYSLKLCN